MTLSSLIFAVLIAGMRADDIFNYGYETETVDGETSYRMADWDRVSCRDEDTCEGWPDKYTHGIGWDLEGNNCEWCPDDNSCGGHRQSPIDLKRNRAVENHNLYADCRDWHWIQYLDDTCSWDDMKNQFQILRHALRMKIPIRDDGEIDCFIMAGGVPKRRFPRLDYSKGFPDWWWMDAVDISVPSQHTQEGKRYDAEVTLEHFYEKDHEKNQVGHVTLLMEAYPDAESWPYLDKLICAWREEEERQRARCDKDPAPPYGRCRIFTERDQEPTEAWLQEAGLITTQGGSETQESPETANPTSSPVESVVEETLTPTSSDTFTPTTWELPVLFSPVFIDPEVPQETAGTPDDTTTTASVTSTTTTDVTATSTVPAVALPAVTTVAPDTTDGQFPFIDCDSFPVDYDRMCYGKYPCCEADFRGESEFCHRLYDNFFEGDLIFSACQHCCTGEPKTGAPPTPEKPGLPKTVKCADVGLEHSLRRICKPDSCCEGQTTGEVCEAIIDQHGSDMEEICYYCCSEPKELPQARRALRGGSMPGLDGAETATQELHEGSKVVYTSKGEKRVLRPESFEEPEDEHIYFDRIHSDYLRRTLQESETLVHEEDYADVAYWPYEWMLKVGTEYYFRYEGTLVVPPCWEHVHWRVFKDPIRVHPRQIEELTRLMSERIAPRGERNSCNPDTAGVTNEDGWFKMNRDIQFTRSNHRKEFCECSDWGSKFEGDQAWCRNWQNDVNYTRFYERPYSFNTDGEW